MAEPKTPTKNGEDTDKKAPTPGEAMFFFAIVKYTKNKADIDWHGVAQEAGFKNAGVAKVRFGQIKRKLGITSDAGTTPKKEPTPASAKVKKAPARRAGAKGGRKKNIKKEDDTDEDETMKQDDYDSDGTAVKGEMDPDAQLQADMDAMINSDPF